MSELKIPDDLKGEYYLLDFQPPGTVRGAAYCKELIERIAASEQRVHDLELEAEGLRERVKRLEEGLRKEWAGNHGCSLMALYGDDGELQCSECFTDFKHLPIEDLWKHVLVARIQAAQNAMPGATVTPRVRGQGPFDPRCNPQARAALSAERSKG